MQLVNKTGIGNDVTVHLVNEGSLQTLSMACCRHAT